MLIWVFFAASSLIGLIYAYNVWTYAEKNSNTYKFSSSKGNHIDIEGISVLIPFRNERPVLSENLSSLLAQELEGLKVEFIYINDHSEDQGEHLLRPFEEQGLIRLIDLEAGVTGKKSALELGINEAKYPWILTSDADCTYSKYWLQAIAKTLGRHDAIDACCAPVNIPGRSKFIHSFQFWDMLAVMGMTAAGHRGLGFAMANGANFAFRKSVFVELGGYDGARHLASGDDMFMVAKIANREGGDIVFADDLDASVHTRPIGDWGALFQQRLRWAGKTNAYQDFTLKYHIGLSFVFSSLIILAWGLSIFESAFLSIALSLLFFRLAIDFLYLRFMARKYSQPVWDVYFPFVQLFHILYIVLIGCCALFMKTYQWKGRRLQ